jgi:type VI secretion system secreted protein Hcp
MKKKLFLAVTAILFASLFVQAQTIILLAETRQGYFKGESNIEKFKGKSEITGFLQEVNSPRDAATGAASGRAIFQPVILLKQSGASSAQYFQALTSNELLKRVVLDFYRRDMYGQEVNFYSITLENVSVAGYKQFIGPLDNERFNPANNILFDEIKLVYQRITIEDKIGRTITTADWSRQ